ncbi:hypothetical protein [Acinetobacter sp. c3-l95]|uniref:hypothetical protein n=1 Tax=Acinetobacter sp. c3-l95 TaxID=3342804 RepID=UPI0035B6FBC0
MRKLILLFIVVLLTGCNETANNQSYEGVLLRNNNVKAVKLEGDNHLMVSIDLPQRDAVDVVNSGFLSMQQALTDLLKSGKEPNSKQIYFTFYAEIVDASNHQTREPIFDIYFDTPELKTLNLENNITFYDYLRLAKVSIRQPVGYKALSEWCKSDDNSKFGNICHT